MRRLVNSPRSWKFFRHVKAKNPDTFLITCAKLSIPLFFSTRVRDCTIGMRIKKEKILIILYVFMSSIWSVTFQSGLHPHVPRHSFLGLRSSPKNAESPLIRVDVCSKWWKERVCWFIAPKGERGGLSAFLGERWAAEPQSRDLGKWNGATSESHAS